MAIAKIKKLKILYFLEDKNRLIDFLQEMGLIQVILTKEFPDLENFSISTLPLNEDLEKIKLALEFLGKSSEENYVSLTQEEFLHLVKEFNYQDFLKELERIKIQIQSLKAEKLKLIEDFKNLLFWEELDLDLEDLNATFSCRNVLGFIPKKKFSSFLKEISFYHVHVEVIKEDKFNKYLFITYLTEEEKINEIFKKFNFNRFNLVYKKGKVKEILKSLQEKIKNIDQELSILEEKIKELAKDRFKLMAICDYLVNLKNKQEIQKNFKRTKSTFLIEAWIKENDIKYLQKELALNFPLATLFIEEPSPTEKIPSVLENKKLFRPFEVVTNLYGSPLYGWIDPTPYLAIFFTFILALCLTDAGYGLVLALVSYLVLKKKYLSKTAKMFFQLFFVCGLFTIFTGALVGSWFGNLLDKHLFLKALKDKIVLFDPLKSPLNFLFLSLGVGFLEVVFGLFLRFFKEIKNRLYFRALFCEGATILLQVSLLILLLIFFKFLPSSILPLGSLAFILGCLLIIIYQLKVQKDLALKLFWSVYGLYSIIAGNFLADTLSFCRIFALGLTTSLLATAINEIYFILPVLFRIIFIPGFILAHFLNLGINLLGAYVHTSRLQYLEFFTKFFEGQEEIFRPFKKEFNFVRLKGGL